MCEETIYCLRGSRCPRDTTPPLDVGASLQTELGNYHICGTQLDNYGNQLHND